MSITHAELFRLLPLAVGKRPYTVAGNRIIVDAEPGSVEIEYSGEQQRRIASLVLPVTHLHLRFRGATPEAAAAFMKRFDLSFQRGGG